MSGHRRACERARDRIVSRAMMGIDCFIPLKARLLRRSSRKTA
jgi:hypothetical protein